MSFRVFAVFCVTMLALVAAQDARFPVNTCKHDTPDYSSCLRLAIQEAWPFIIKGIPELDLPVLDPYHTERQRTVYQTDQLSADITVMDVNTYGLTKTRFLAVRPFYSEDFFKVEVDIELPKLLIEGDYSAVGALGTFKIGGDGHFNISLEDLRATLSMEGPVVNDRWVIEHVYINPEIGRLRIWFSNLFNGDEELNAAAMRFANEYWPSLYRAMLPFVSQQWDKHFTELSNRIFSKISFSQLFP